MTPPVVVWTARLAVALWIVRWVLQWGGRTSLDRSRLIAGVWTAGCLVYLVHCATALGIVHDWSHTAAWRHTAEQTRRVVGWETGVGIWFNHLFTLLWPIHVGDAWTRFWRGRPLLTPYIRTAIDQYLTFIVLNATLVFGPRGWWWVTAAAVATAWILRTISRARPAMEAAVSPDSDPT